MVLPMCAVAILGIDAMAKAKADDLYRGFM